MVWPPQWRGNGIGCAYLDRYSYMLDDGTPHHVADPVRFLIKPCDPR